MGFRHFPRTPYAPWTNSLVEVQSTEQKAWYKTAYILTKRSKDWAHEVHMYAYAPNSQPISSLKVSPHEIVFHTRPRIL